MIIQTTQHINQAVQPDTRAIGAIPARAAVTVPVQTTQRPPSPEELKNALAVINRTVQQSNRNLEFSVDSGTDRTVVRMIDTSTGELIRQFPSEAALAISRDIEHFQQGLLLKQDA